MSQADDSSELRITILLVEDNVAHAELLIRSLEDLNGNWRIVHVCDGEAALAYLIGGEGDNESDRAPRPDVVLLDLRMPKMGGLEVLQQIRTSKRLQSLPVVVVTTSDAKPDVETASRLGADRYLVKPIVGHDLGRVLCEVTGVRAVGAG